MKIIIMENLIYTTLNNYLLYLNKFGYTNIEEVNKILILLWIKEILDNKYFILSNEDIINIKKAYYKLFGTSYIIPFKINTVK